ncbi:MAG TPA: hypothetical protein VNE41_12400, partial [Chitinophagaceae bacterium]|nr:hypothetical protein [Chitinophagaceae bacterium]
VFIHDAKQHLMVDKRHSNDFNVQGATISLAFMHYMVLAPGKRFEVYETISMMFNACKDFLSKKTLLERIWALLTGINNEVLTVFRVQWDTFIQLVIAIPEIKKFSGKVLHHFFIRQNASAVQMVHF